MDKIYSRKRIRMPKIKHKKINKIKVMLLTIIMVIIVSAISFVITAYPIFVASCKTAAGSKATHIVNNEVRKVMSEYTYNDLIDIEKDGNGDIELMKFNTVLINKATSQIVSNIQDAIDDTSTVMVYINYGTVSRNNYAKELGTKI